MIITRKQRIGLVLIVLSSIILTSCSLLTVKTKIEDYQQGEAIFTLESYFSGPVIAWGMIQDYTNKVNRRFCVELNGTWQRHEGQLIGELDEWFYFDDGEVSQRIWRLKKVANDKYVGGANDVVGEAKGKIAGFALQWQYELLVEIDDTTYQFVLDDWMYQIDEFRVFNRTAMKKFGIEVAEITLFFDKQTPLRQCQSGHEIKHEPNKFD